MIYFVGVEHNLQHTGNQDRDFIRQRKLFVEYIQKEIKNRRITFVVEEFVEEFFNKGGNGSSVVQPITRNSRIDHIFLEKSLEERESNGIKDPNLIKTSSDKQVNQRKRELFWYSKIKDRIQIHENILMILGANHIKPFTGLLTKEGLKSQTLIRLWSSTGKYLNMSALTVSTFDGKQR